MANISVDHRSLSQHFFALFNFTPTIARDPSRPANRQDLSFFRNDEFLLDPKKDQTYWLAQNLRNSEVGFVPRNYVARILDRETIELCHLEMNREEANALLCKTNLVPGSFLIRSSNGRDFAEATLKLSIKHTSEEIFHYMILRDKKLFGLKSDEAKMGTPFPSLTEFVKHYARFPDSLKQCLVYSVKLDKNIVDDAWEIDANSIQWGEKIGSGHFGSVSKAKLYGRMVAVKTVYKEVMTTEDFLREAEIARHITHENIVRTIGVCPKMPCIVNELVLGGDLKTYLKELHKDGRMLTPSENQGICHKIACGMAHLEKNRIVHRDIAARNILVGRTHDTIKVADFGLARCLTNSSYYKTYKGIFPYKWTAPEAYVLDSAGRSRSSSDVWSFAVVMWEVYSRGSEPYPGLRGVERLHHFLTETNNRLSRPIDCPNNIYAKMMECWSLIPESRPTFAQLCEFFACSNP